MGLPTAGGTIVTEPAGVRNRFRIAIVGCGRISNAHVQTVLSCPDAELVALLDPVESRAKALAQRNGVDVAIYTGIGEAMRHADGAIIATPNHLHAEHALLCIEAGVAVLVEKPLAISVADGQRICEAAETAGVVVATGYTTRFRKNVLLMRDLLRRRTFGRVRGFVYQLGTRGGWAPLSAYNLDLRTSGGGVLVVSGTHFLDRMLDWFGYPVAAALTDDSHGGPEAHAIATFTFDDPAGPITGKVRFSKSVSLEGGTVFDTEAGIVILRDQPDAPIVLRSPHTPHVENLFTPRVMRPPGPDQDEWQLQLEDFIRAARTASDPMVSGRQGLESLRLLEQLYRNRTALSEEWYPSLSAVEVRA
jgi:predicted dehydrogenase